MYTLGKLSPDCLNGPKNHYRSSSLSRLVDFQALSTLDAPAIICHIYKTNRVSIVYLFERIRISIDIRRYHCNGTGCQDFPYLTGSPSPEHLMRSIVSTITNREKLHFTIYQTECSPPVFLAFLKSFAQCDTPDLERQRSHPLRCDHRTS